MTESSRNVPDEELQRAIHEEIEIVEYCADWPALFEAERARLERLFPGRFLHIEHIGSTAVPGLSAKPIIDLNAAVSSMEEADDLLAGLCAEGYTTSEEFNRTLVDRRWLMRQSEGKRTHHLHLVLPTSSDWRRKLRFRDILRDHSSIAMDYAKLKRSLAHTSGADREGYTNAKTAFIESALATPLCRPEDLFVYAFAPFGEWDKNTSAEVLRRLPEKLTCRSRVFPVVYEPEMFLSAFEEHRPRYILGMGQTRRPGLLQIERRARNVMNRRDGNPVLPIEANAEDERRLSWLLPMEAATRMSQDAGDYLCNYSSWLAEGWARRNGARFAFLHIPIEYPVDDAAHYVTAAAEDLF